MTNDFTPDAVMLRTCDRNGVEVRSFDDDEDAMLEEMSVAGATNSDIARACMSRFSRKRSPHTICIRLKMLAARAEAAQ
jgi:hypothetical protein